MPQDPDGHLLNQWPTLAQEPQAAVRNAAIPDVEAASEPQTFRRSYPQARGAGPQFKHQAREVSHISAIQLEDQSGSTSTQQHQQQQQQQKPPLNGSSRSGGEEPIIVVAEAKLLPDADPLSNPEEDSSRINFGGDMSRMDGGKGISKKNAQTRIASATSHKKYWIFAAVFVGILVAVGAIVAIVVALADKGDPDSSFFPPAGSALNGPTANAYVGTGLALSQSGNRMAVASPTSVSVYEFTDGKDWQRLGQPIPVAGENAASKLLNLQGENLIAVDLDDAGAYLVIGYGAQSSVRVFRFVESKNEWDTVGQNLTMGGSSFAVDQERLRFGASVSISANGDTVSVGAPGPENSPGYCFIYRRDSDEQYRLLGSPIQGQISPTVSQLGRSVSLSAEGKRVAVGARSMANGSGSNATDDDSTYSNVVSVYEYEYDVFGNRTWTQMGIEIRGVSPTKETGWYVDLDASGERMAVSNTYLNPDDFANKEGGVLMVQVYEFENGSWTNFGDVLHANTTGSKSGFVISLSDDGLTMAMGDRGTDHGGRTRGHAHIYEYIDNKWIQSGPNVEGKADGDNFGFAVAISGDGTRFAAGAPFSRAANSDAGQVQAFDI